MKKLMMTILGVALGCASSLFAEGVINSQSYVSTDLVGQWDAIENNGVGQHSDSITEWKDLTGKTGDFSLRSDIASIEDSAIRKTGKGCMGSIDAEQRKDIRTIEVVVSEVPIDAGYWIPTVFVTKDQNISIFDSTSKTYPGRRFFLDYSTQKTTPVEIPIDIATVVGLYRDATTATNCYQNGEILGPLNPASGSDHWAQDHGRISLCGIYGADNGDEYNGNKVFGHRIHAIRFYKRELTPAEIVRNAFVDSIRFASNEVAEVSRCFLTDDGKAMVSVKVDIEKAQCCELSATVRDLSTGTTTESVLGTAADSNTHDYEITGLTFGRRYEVVIHGTWVFSAEQKVKMALRSLPVCVCDSLRYVQNGLVGQWDAIENAGIGLHSDGIASWSDLTGSTGDFELDVNIAEIGEQDIFKKGQGCLGSIDAPRRTDVKTIEAVISETPYNTWVNTVFISKTQHVSVTAGSSSRTFFYDDNRKIASADTMPVPATVVGLYSDNATVTNGYQNGVKIGEMRTSTTAYWSSDSTRISLCGTFGAGNTSGANSRTGYKIHAVRFYTRELTPDEIARHAFIDQLRFSPGGLATAKWSVTGDSKVKVYGTVNTLGGNAECELSAICREGGTGVTTTNELGTVSDSKGTFEYTFEGLDASKQYDIVLHGVWTMQADNSVTFASDFRAEAETISAGAQAYVQNGLVGQWDAIENAGIDQHSDSITEWVDLTGQTGNFTLNSGVTTIEDSAMLKKASGVMGTVNGASRRTDVRTIEAVVSELPSSGWVAAVLITPKQTVTMSKSYSGSPAAFFDDQHYGKKGFGLTSLMTFTGLYESDMLATNSYQNGGLMTGEDFKTHWSKDPGVISMGGVEGIDNATSPKGYRIHAIRFYTRELTPDEIARNAFLDQLRFTGNGIAEVSRTVVGDNGEMRVAIAVNTLGGSSPCTLTALVRNRATGKMEPVELATSVSDSALHEYTISNLDPSLNYEIVIHGSWKGGDFDLKTFDVSPEVDALPGTVYQVAASASATNAFDWVVAGSGLRRPPKAGDTVYVGLTNGTYQLLLSGAESKLIDLRAFAGAGMVGVTPKVTVQEGAVVSTRDGFAVGAATADMTAKGELRVSGGSLTAGGQGIVCAGGNQLVQVYSNSTLSASKLSILDSASMARFRIIGSDADITLDAVDPSVAPTSGKRKNTPVFWDYRFDTTAVPGGPGVAPRKMSASDATVHGHFRLIPYGGFQLASTNVFPLVVHTGGAALVEGTDTGAKYDPLCTDLWNYTMNGSVLSAVLNPAYEMTNGVSLDEGLVRGYLKLPRIVNPARCPSATVRMKVESAKKSVEDIVAAIREQYPDAQEIDKGGYNVEVPLRLDRLAKGESNKVVFDFSEFTLFDDIESGTVTTNAVVKAIAAEIKKPGIVLIVR